jgi:hypothetical protein
MALVLLVIAIALVAFFAYRARPSAATWGGAELPADASPADDEPPPEHADGDGGARHLEVGHAPLAPDVMTIDERVEIGSIIDDWVDRRARPDTEAATDGADHDAEVEHDIIARCESSLAALADRAGNPDVDTAMAALRSILSMALFRQERFDDCVAVLRAQPVPPSLLEPAQRSVHPLPLLARALAALGRADEARAVLDQDEQLDDRRDPATAASAAADRRRLRATFDA